MQLPKRSIETELKDTLMAARIIGVAYIVSLIMIFIFFSLWQSTKDAADGLRETNNRLIQENEIFRSGPVCHSFTEDSEIWDCDYRRGGWYRK